MHAKVGRWADEGLPNDLQPVITLSQTRPRASSHVERLTEQLENTEAKCLYCGRKMESFLDELQNEVENVLLTPQQEDTIFLALAGLKQVSLNSLSFVLCNLMRLFVFCYLMCCVRIVLCHVVIFALALVLSLSLSLLFFQGEGSSAS